MAHTREEWIAIGAKALREQDKRRRENGERPYSDSAHRYVMAASIVYDAFVAASLDGESISVAP